MGRVRDLTGQRFGNWIVISRAENRDGDTLWHCLCDCGNENNVLAYNLVSGASKSCGCLRHKPSPNFIDLTGRKIGYLLVKNQAGRDKFNRILWNCICDCGNITIVNGTYLLNGDTKSCGCYKQERDKYKGKAMGEKYGGKNSADLINKKFGKLKVLYDTGKRNDNRIIWQCVCDCGNRKEASTDMLNSGHVISCGCQSESYISSEIKKYCIVNYNATAEYRIFKNPKTNRFLPFDIYIPQDKNNKLTGIFIEINGVQHYRITSFCYMQSIRNFNTPELEFEYQLYKDAIKKKFAETNGKYIEIDLRKYNTVEKCIEYIKNFI